MTTLDREIICKPIHLPCGSEAWFDHDSEFSYRCTSCFAVVGSMGMPSHCRSKIEKWDLVKKLGGEGWNYCK